MARSSVSTRAPKRKRAVVISSDDNGSEDVLFSSSSDADDDDDDDVSDDMQTKHSRNSKGKRTPRKKTTPAKSKQFSKAKAKAWKMGDPGGLDRLEELVAHELERGNADKPTLVSLGIRDEVTEVREMKPDSVLDEIELAVAQVIKTVMAGRGFEYRIPSRTETNQRYIAELDRIVLKSENSMVRSFVNVNTAKKAAITTRAMELIHQVLRKKIHITKRDLFYTDVKLFVDQKHSDAVLDDLACMLGCTRTSLHVVASEKGIVVGKLTFRDDGDFIDCSKMGVGGKAIPPYTDRITEITSAAKFILLVEKDAAFMRLAEDRFYNTYPCIIITAKGQPDVATRMFLKRLQAELKIPVLGLVDSDPYGLKILSVYMSGSKAMSYDSESLTTRGIHWLGVRPSDLDRYDIPEQCRLPLTETDIKTGKALLKEEFICKNPEWVKELELMLKTKQKAEIQALSSFGFQYLTQVYLPQKIANGDWI